MKQHDYRTLSGRIIRTIDVVTHDEAELAATVSELERDGFTIRSGMGVENGEPYYSICATKDVTDED
jgi:hypothetical protein